MHEVSFYRQLFEASPHPYLILRADADFTIVAVNNKYLEATGTHRQTIVGCGLFDIFPDNPNELASESVADLRASLNRVLDRRLPDVMGVQKYDIPLRDGSGRFALKYWSPVNTPVLGTDRSVAYIIHHVEDVTEFIASRGRIRGDRETQLKLSKVEARAERMQAEILRRTAEVKEAKRSLKLALKELSDVNQRLNERNYSGSTGLGLAVVKDLVALLDGKVTLHESSGGGALFKIILPLQAPAGSIPMDQPSALDMNTLHQTVGGLQRSQLTELTLAPVFPDNQALVLIVEDNVDMSQFIADTLRGHYRVVCAYTGKQGLEQALAATPDVILCDMTMPVMGGCQMVSALRQYPQLMDVPVIMLTAEVDDGLRLELLKLGVQDYLSKPFVVDELLIRINRLVTERRRIREQLRESEARFQATFEQAAVGIAMVSLEGRWLRANQKLCDMVGYPHDELISLTFQEITYAEDLAAQIDYIRRMLAGEISAYSMEKRYICKDNSVIWGSLTASLVRTQDRIPDYFVTIIQDIQTRKEMEANLNDAKRIANFGHWKWDFSTNKQIWSEEIFHIFGRDLDLPPASYQEIPQYFTAQSWNNLAAAVEKCANEGVGYQCDAEVVKPDGSQLWVVARGEAIRDAEGQIIALHGTVQDITARKLTEVALQQLNINLEQRIAERTAELEVLNQSLESFVYSVSHDLKTPLRGVEGYSRLLEEDYTDRLNDEGRLFISNIRAGVRRMNELINDLLAYSRMERRKLESNVLDLTTLIHQALTEHNEAITARQIVVITDLSSFKVYGDREGLALVLRNLLENAIKFSQHSPCPRIEIGAYREKDQVILWIRDNGIGFDMKYNQRIFEIFERLHRLEDYAGTGVGLALVKKAMQRMNGRVWAQSTPGEGATFSIELPAATAKPEG